MPLRWVDDAICPEQPFGSSFDDLVGLREHQRRQGQAEGIRRFHIHYKFELRRLDEGQVQASRSPAYPCFRSPLIQPTFEKEHYPASLRNARCGNTERQPSFHAGVPARKGRWSGPLAGSARGLGRPCEAELSAQIAVRRNEDGGRP